ncbi:MAG TPA: CRISPR-associated endonuclease Cas2 [Bacteroidales bacterium]|nr:CRISPR-associated endonuclease Cas2 [Bacteroidales bacterium]HQA84688.1 CRISPR-associated endonuclease Cas2 [Erysipelotrichaceae bacterium]
MYVVITYDVDAKRCNKIMKLLRQYLFHVQKSVFEGELNPNKLEELKEKISNIIIEDDSIRIYYTYNNKQLYKSSLGQPIKNFNIII